MYEELFYARLTALRQAKGGSAREMSLALGQSEGYINAIENQKGFPSMEAFFYICEYLGVTPREFFDDETGYTPQSRELLRQYELLEQEEREHVSGIIAALGKRNRKRPEHG